MRLNTDFRLAYFDEAYDGIFGVVFRPAFETRLRQQLEGHFPDDMSWYALRNVVYASGCRILLSKDPSLSFADVQQQAWSFFENAISTHTDLLCTPTGLPAVQAIALMVCSSRIIWTANILKTDICRFTMWRAWVVRLLNTHSARAQFD